MKKKLFRFSAEQNLAAYEATKALNGMKYIRKMYTKEYIDEMEELIKKAKEISEPVQIYVEHLLPLINEARSKVIKAGGRPNVMYIGDIFPRKKDELALSPVKLDTGCKVFGMRIIADYRVPFDKFYIMQGEL